MTNKRPPGLSNRPQFSRAGCGCSRCSRMSDAMRRSKLASAKVGSCGVHHPCVGEAARVAAGDGFGAEIDTESVGESSGGECREQCAAGAADIENAISGVDVELAEQAENEFPASAKPPVLFFEGVIFLLKLGIQRVSPRGVRVGGRCVRRCRGGGLWLVRRGGRGIRP